MRTRAFGARKRELRKLWTGWRWRVEFLIGTPIPANYGDELASTIKRVRRDTMTTSPRIAALVDSLEYVARNDVEGDIVECGVWRGGSMMAAAITLLRLGIRDRDIWLFDTFGGMPKPGKEDVSSWYDGYDLHRRWRRKSRGGRSSWNLVSPEAVRDRVESTGYPPERIHLVKGMVEDTIPAQAPESIALLRLDTDWYESTQHELEHLYPRLSEGGVLIIDDYGHYEGARRAVDEYLERTGERLLLSRIDYTGRLAVKQAARGDT
jgi:O-methyltransferase